MTIGLIDGDIILFRAAASCEREVQWDEHNHVLSSNFEEVKDHIHTAMEAIYKDLRLDEAWVAFTGKGNFRKDLTDTYKAHRKAVRKPLCYSRAKEWMYRNWRCAEVDTLEGDDLLGIWQTRENAETRLTKNFRTIIVSADKDMATIPGRHAKFNSNENKWFETKTITEDEADFFWMMQTLTGDTADGYKGLPGCGPVKALKILDGKPSLAELWSSVVGAFERAQLGAEDALLQARLARILRASDWDTKKKEVKLWTP